MIRILCGTVVAAMLATAAQCGEGSAARIGNAAAKPRIWFNEDNEHFYMYHAGDEMTAEGCRTSAVRRSTSPPMPHGAG